MPKFIRNRKTKQVFEIDDAIEIPPGFEEIPKKVALNESDQPSSDDLLSDAVLRKKKQKE